MGLGHRHRLNRNSAKNAPLLDIHLLLAAIPAKGVDRIVADHDCLQPVDQFLDCFPRMIDYRAASGNQLVRITSR